MKMLYILNTTNRVDNFSYSSILAAKELSIEFHIAGNWTGYDNSEDKKADEKKHGITIHQIDFIRTPYDPRNIKAYRQVVKLIRKEKFDIIHCNTPIGGVIGRIAGKRCGVKQIIYQAHGFHFYKGAPLKNWLIFYPIEKICSYFTDVLITINKEDYALAQKKMKAKKIVYVPGVGIDLKKFADISVDKAAKRKELGIPTDSILLLSVGELNENKNHETVIRALNEIENENTYYIIAGKGEKKERLENLIKKLYLEKRIKILGYRTDVNELYMISDIFVFPSYREGLSVALMEAMTCGLPCAVSRIRGNVDLIDEGKGGILFAPSSIEDIKNTLNKFFDSNFSEMKKYNFKKIKKFGTSNVNTKIKKIYGMIIQKI